jgi:hypothetical protein
MTAPTRDEARERLLVELLRPIAAASSGASLGKPTINYVTVRQEDLRALLSPEQGWREIESAPKDGRSVLVFCPRASDHGYERIRLTWRKDGKWQGANNTSWPPTHWRPLPAPPTKGGE